MRTIVIIIAMIILCSACSNVLDYKGLYVDEQAGFSLCLLSIQQDSAVILITSSDDTIDRRRWKVRNGQERLNCNGKQLIFNFRIEKDKLIFTVKGE